MEIELKYRADRECGLNILEELSKKYNAEIREIPMEAIYYDTADLSLLDKRFTYRLRKEGNEIMLTVKYGKGSDKAKEGLHRRGEINVPVFDDFLEKPGIDVLEDTPIYKELDKAVGGQYSDDLGIMLPRKPLLPRMEMRFLRKEITVPLNEGGKSSAVLSYDEGEILAGGRTLEISEVEIELSEGNEEDLRAFGEKIAQKYGLEPLNKSKYARGLKLLGE